MRKNLRGFAILFFAYFVLAVIPDMAHGQQPTPATAVSYLNTDLRATILAFDNEEKIASLPSKQNKPNRFTIDFEFMPLHRLEGNNAPYGEKYYLHERVSGGAFPSVLPDPNNPHRVDYGLTSEPLSAKMKPVNTFGGRVMYQLNSKWDIGFSGSYFETSGHDQGRVTTPPSDLNNLYINGVGMFGQRIVPARNDLEPQGQYPSYPFSPVNYQAENRISISRGSAFLTRNLFKREKDRLKLFIGLDVVDVNNMRSEGQKQRAFISFERGFNFDHLDNNISLDLNSRADYGWMRGPSIGIQWESRLTKKLELEVFAKQAFVWGNVGQSGALTDVDDIKRVRGPRLDGSFMLIERARFEGVFPFSLTESITVPTTDFNLKIRYNLNKHLALGVGFATTYLQNVAVAPVMNFPGLWTAVGGTSWITQRRNLFLHGISTSISFSR